MIKINEELLREAIDQQIRECRDKYNLLDVSDFDLTTLTAMLSGYIQGYCKVND